MSWRNRYCSRPYQRTLPSSAFSPTLFSGGEGGRRPDEGALHQRDIRANATFSARIKRGAIGCTAHALPPHPAFGHLLPPQKARGEKALEWREHQELGRVATSSASSMCEMQVRPSDLNIRARWNAAVSAAGAAASRRRGRDAFGPAGEDVSTPFATIHERLSSCHWVRRCSA